MFLLLISLVCYQILLFIVLSDEVDPAPPIWPNAFSVGAREHWYYIDDNGKYIEYGVNNAYWYYDYTNLRMRIDHDEGQTDNFCYYNVELPVQCQLLMDPSGVMYINYPSLDYCCRFCNVGQYCTVLKPTWIENGEYDGKKMFNNRSCNVWNETGFVANDNWAQDDNDVPCAYFEFIEGEYYHEIDFNATTYIIGEPADSIFKIPDNCHKVCNHTIRNSTTNLF